MLLWNQVSADPIRAAEALIKLEAREARLLGLDMPSKLEVTEKGNGIPLEALRALMNRADVEGIADFEKLRDGLRDQGYAPTTINQILRIASSVFRLAIKHGNCANSAYDSASFASLSSKRPPTFNVSSP